MKFLLGVLCVLLLIPVILVIRDWYVQFKLRQLTATKYNALKGLIQKLSSEEIIQESEIADIARMPSLRVILYGLLETHERTNLFPAEYYTEEKGAESYMVDWLEFPTELGRAPDDIQLLKNVAFDPALTTHYYVFRFRTSVPVWASKRGWMLGVCGPYDENSLPFDIPEKIFSRFNRIDLITPEAEVQWVHERINV
jgi:hypothetical protein